MKKLLQKLLLFSALFGIIGIAVTNEAQAQIELDTPNWEVLADDVGWLSISNNETRGMAVNPVTGNLIVATRAGGTGVIAISTEDGSVVRNLDIGAITGGYFAVNRIAITDDGQIFVTNFSLSGPEHRIYWWANEEADAKMVWDGNPYSARIGDGFGVTGTGDDIKVYVSGTFQNRMAEFTWNSDTEMLQDMRLITLPYAENANASILEAPDNPDYLWINGRDAPIVKIDRDGNLIREYGAELVPLGNGELDIMTVNGSTFMVTGVRAPGDNAFTIIDITSEEAPYIIARTRDLTIHPNDFRVADVAFDEITSTVSLLVTNSGIFNFTIDVDELITDELIGAYFIPQGDFARGFPSLKEAFDTLNVVGTSGPVTLFITDDLDHSNDELLLLNAGITETSPLMIKPAPGASPTITLGATTEVEGGTTGLGIVNTSWVTIDGSNTSGGTTRDMTIMTEAEGVNFMMAVLWGSKNVTIRNSNIMHNYEATTIPAVRSRRDGNDTMVPENLLLENNQIGSPDKPFGIGMVAWGTESNPIHVKVLHNEIYARQRGVTTFWNLNNEFIGNTIELHDSPENQGLPGGLYLVLHTGGETVVANNVITRLSVNRSEVPGYIAGININSNIGDILIYNNLLGVTELEDLGAAKGSKVGGIAISNAAGSSNIGIYHNTFRFLDQPDAGLSSAIVWDVVETTMSYDFVNNIVHNEIDNETAYAMYWPHSGAALSSNYNNLMVAGDNAHVGFFEEENRTTLANWREASGKDLRSVSVPVEFAADDDWRLTGGSNGDIHLAGTPIAAVTVDFDGTERDEFNPYMGAFEGDIVLIPEPDIRPFALLAPSDGATVDLGAVTENIVISWEFPQSIVAWSRFNGQFADDQFAHVGEGESGQGRYIGTQNDIDAWLQTPLLENPGTLGFWGSTFSNATVLDMVIELSEDGETWEELAVLEARDGGTGDINVVWSYHEVEINREGEFYVRFSQSGTVNGSFYLDDVMVDSFTFDEVVLEEDFEDWEAYRSMRFTWHIDVTGSQFNNPALSLPSDRNGEATTLTLTAAQVDNALASLGVEEGATFTGDWTVTVALGEEVLFADAPFGISLTRLMPTGIVADQPYEFALDQNYPNPFNPGTKIRFTLPETMEVRLDVYTVAGQRVATLINGQREAGAHTVEFDGSRVASGVYIYRIVAGSHVQTRQMTLIK